MTINEFVNNPDMCFNAPLCIRCYNDDTGELNTILDTRESGWGDIPFDVCEKEVTAVSTEGSAIVLEYFGGAE